MCRCTEKLFLERKRKKTNTSYSDNSADWTWLLIHVVIFSKALCGALVTNMTLTNCILPTVKHTYLSLGPNVRETTLGSSTNAKWVFSSFETLLQFHIQLFVVYRSRPVQLLYWNKLGNSPIMLYWRLYHITAATEKPGEWDCVNVRVYFKS